MGKPLIAGTVVTAADDAAVTLLQQTNALLDGRITELALTGAEHRVVCALQITPMVHRFGRATSLTVLARGVQRFDFYYDSDVDFYTIERYKLLRGVDGFYLALDPVDESTHMSPDDRGVVVCGNLEVTVKDD